MLLHIGGVGVDGHSRHTGWMLHYIINANIKPEQMQCGVVPEKCVMCAVPALYVFLCLIGELLGTHFVSYGVIAAHQMSLRSLCKQF